MGNNCQKCLLFNTCCLCWCGWSQICCFSNYTQENMTEIDWHDENQFLKDIENWKTGDIVFKRGAYARSLPSMAMSNSYWCHVIFVYRPDNEILKQQGKWIKDSKVLFIEAVINQYDDKYVKRDIKGCLASDAAKTFNAYLYNEKNVKGEENGIFFGYRKLKKELTKEQKINLEKAVNEVIGKPYNGTSLEDLGAVRASIDCAVCYMPCCESETNKDKLHKVFCSEVVGHLLKSIDALPQNVISDELMPSDFLSGRIEHYTNGEDPFGPLVYYSQKRKFN